jgi:hypothetical protein
MSVRTMTGWNRWAETVTKIVNQLRWKHCLDPVRTNREIAWICLEFLSLKDIKKIAKTLISKFDDNNIYSNRIIQITNKTNSVKSFLIYSTEHWPSHL